VLRIATRASALARWQAERVGALLGVLLDEPVEYVLITTTGDRDQRPDLHSIGGTGVFVKEVQQAVLDDRADLAVHSAKDLPSETPAGLHLAAVPERGDPRDALVGSRLEEIPTGGRVGTGSVRRRAQLAAARPDLVFAPLRGNMETRLRKRLEEGHDAIVVAVAALDRLGLRDQVTEVLNTTVMLPQAAQGALAVECRADDDKAHAALAAIDDRVAHFEVRAERAYLAELGGGCSLPCGALARADDGSGQVVLEALLAAPDGHVLLRTRVAGSDPIEVGAAAARDLLDAKGGRDLLDAELPA
jgi:hydroxymethylbilane synthase